VPRWSGTGCDGAALYRDGMTVAESSLFSNWIGPGPSDPGVTRVGDQWLVTRHALVRQVLADPVSFAPDNALDAVTPLSVPALRILVRYGFRLPPTLANNGTPSHPALRGIVADALHPHRVAAQRDWLTGVVRRRVVTITASLRAGDPVDLDAAVSRDLPLAVLGRLVDLPSDEVAVVKRFSAAALELFWAPLTPQRQQELATVVGQYYARLRRFAETASGLVSTLREYALSNGLSMDEVVGVLFFLLVAGQETTSQYLTLLMRRLIAEPELPAALSAGRVSVEDVVEEGLRLEPPIVTWRRVTTRDVVLGGVPIPAGASVLLGLARAGRDETVVAEPHRFIPGQRGSRRHLAFGAGAHRCLGAQLARMEATVVISELAPVLRRCRVIAEPTFPPNLSFRMPDRLVVTW